MSVSYDLGTASGKVVITSDTSGVTAAGTSVAGLDSHLNKLGSTLSSAQRSLNVTSKVALAAGAVIAGGFVYAVKTATDFTHELSAIQSVSGATASQMDLINDAALRIGKDTVFSASQAASAMEELFKQGISVTDVLNGAADATVALAAAGGVDIPEAAQIAANAMNEFKLSAQDLTHVADLFAGAANASATDVHSIGEALSFVGPVAKAAGLSIDETAEAIAVLSNNGIDGMKAGTALRAILSQLQPSSKKAAGAMKELGLITKDGTNAFYDQNGQLKSLRDILGVLHGAFSGLTEEQKISYGTIIYGRDSLAAINAVAATTTDEFDKLATALEGTKAADVAATRMNNLAGQTEQLKGSVETLGIGVGQLMIPAILKMVTALTGAVNWVLDLSKSTKEAIIIVGLLTSGFLLFFGVAAKITAAVLVLRDAFIVATGAEQFFAAANGKLAATEVIAAAATAGLAATINKLPLIALITVIGVLIAAYVEWVMHNKQAQESFKPVIAAIQQLGNVFAPVGKNLTDGLTKIAKVLTSALVPVFKTLTDILVAVLVPVIKLLTAVLEPVVSIISELLTPALALLGVALTAVGAVVNIVLKILKPFLDLLTFIITAALQPIIVVLDLVSKGLNVLGAVVDKVFGFISAALKPVGDAFSKLYTEFIKPFVDDFNRGLQRVEDKATELYQKYIAPVFDKIKAALKPLWDEFKRAIESGITKILDDFAGALQRLLTRAEEVWKKLQPILEPVIAVWKKAIKSELILALDALVLSLEALYAEAKFVWDAVKLIVSGAKDDIQKNVDVLRLMLKPLIDVYDALKAKVKEVIDFVIAHWSDIKSKLQPDFVKLQDALYNLQHAWDQVKGAVDNVVLTIESSVTKIETALQPLSDAFHKVFDALFGAPASKGDTGTVNSQVKDGMDGVVSSVDTGAGATEGRFQRMLDVITKIIDGVAFVINVIAIVVETVVGTITPLIDGVASTTQWMADGVSAALNGLSGFFTKAGTDVANAITGIKSTISTVESAVKGAVANAGSWLLHTGEDIISGLITGIKNTIKNLGPVLKSVGDYIVAHKGPPAYDKIMLQPSGQLIMNGLINGIKDKLPALGKMLSSVSSAIPDTVQQQIDAQFGGGGADGDRTFNYYAAAGGPQLSGRQDLFRAMQVSKVVVPGWA